MHWATTHPVLFAGHCRGMLHHLKVRSFPRVLPLSFPWSVCEVQWESAIESRVIMCPSGFLPWTVVPTLDSGPSSHTLFTHQAMPRPLTSGSDGQMFCAGEELIEAAKRNDFCKVPVRA